MKDNRRNISIKGIITIVFILAMLISTGGIGYLIFTSWLSSAEQTTKSIAGDINENIYNDSTAKTPINPHFQEEICFFMPNY